MNIVACIALGVVMGLTASIIMDMVKTNPRPDTVTNVVLGVVGAVGGGVITSFVGWSGITEFKIYGLVTAIIGTIITILMKLFESFIIHKMKEANKREMMIRVLGNFERLPISLQKVLEKAIDLTKNNQKMIVNVALSYGGRDEIIRSFRKLTALGTKVEEITEELISQNLDTAGLPDPDFIIRTSGEQRLSNFLPWQATYSELYFSKVYWPDFDKTKLDITILEFQNRQRRLGK